MEIIFHEDKSVPSQIKETQIKTKEIYGERFEDSINMEASWLVAYTLTSRFKPESTTYQHCDLGKKTPLTSLTSVST